MSPTPRNPLCTAVCDIEIPLPLLDSQSLLSWLAGTQPELCGDLPRQAAKLFVALGVFNSLISVFLWEMQLPGSETAVGAQMVSDCYLEC